MTTPSLWSRFSLVQDKKGKAGIPFPQICKRAGVGRVMALLRLYTMTKFDFNALQHELIQSHGNRIGS
jgi:hypothetical protein